MHIIDASCNNTDIKSIITYGLLRTKNKDELIPYGGKQPYELLSGTRLGSARVSRK